MGLFSSIKKAFKKVFKGIGKVFKAVGKFVKKVVKGIGTMIKGAMKGDLMSIIMIAAIIYTGGAMMGAWTSPFASSGALVGNAAAGSTTALTTAEAAVGAAANAAVPTLAESGFAGMAGAAEGVAGASTFTGGTAGFNAAAMAQGAGGVSALGAASDFAGMAAVPATPSMTVAGGSNLVNQAAPIGPDFVSEPGTSMVAEAINPGASEGLLSPESMGFEGAGGPDLGVTGGPSSATSPGVLETGPQYGYNAVADSMSMGPPEQMGYLDKMWSGAQDFGAEIASDPFGMAGKGVGHAANFIKDNQMVSYGLLQGLMSPEQESAQARYDAEYGAEYDNWEKKHDYAYRGGNVPTVTPSGEPLRQRSSGQLHKRPSWNSSTPGGLTPEQAMEAKALNLTPLQYAYMKRTGKI